MRSVFLRLTNWRFLLLGGKVEEESPSCLYDLEEMRVTKEDKEFVIRTDTKKKVKKVLQAVGLQSPKK